MKKYEFSDDFYYEFAKVLVDKVDGHDYWAGSLDFSFDNVDIKFDAVITIEYTTCQDVVFAGYQMINRVVPIWWTIEVDVDGEDCGHDFDFDNVREYLEC